MKKLAFVIILLVLFTAATQAENGASHLLSKQMRAEGFIDSDRISAVAFTEYYEGDFSYGFLITGEIDTSEFFCRGSNIGSPVNINGSAKLGSFEIDTSLLSCSTGTPPAIIYVKCKANYDEFWHEVETEATAIINEKYNSADCVIYADGESYDGEGNLIVEHYIWPPVD